MEEAGEGYLPVFQDAASPHGAVMFGFRAGPAVAVVELPSPRREQVFSCM